MPTTRPTGSVLLAHVALGWLLACATLRMWWQVHGRPGDLSPIGGDLVGFTGWWAVALTAAAALLAAALPHAPARASGRLVVAALVLGTALVASAAMLVLDVIAALFPGIGLESHPAGAVSRAAWAGGGILVVAAAEAGRRHHGVDLPRAELLRTIGTPLTRTPHWAFCAAYVSVTACLVRIGAQVAVGPDGSPLSSGPAGIAFEACFVLAGTLLPLALVHAWGRVWPRWVLGLAGRRVPRWLVLGPGIAVSAMIVVYFGVMLAQMVVERLQGRNPFPPDGRMDLPETFFWVAVPAYVVWGATLGAAALSYWRRTRSQEGSGSLPGGMDRRLVRATVES